MRVKKYLFILLSFIYMDFIFNVFAYDNYLVESLINMVLFAIIHSLFVFILTSLFSVKSNKVLIYIIYTFLGIWYSLYYIFYKVLITPFSIALFRQADQPLKFGRNVIMSILQNLHIIILFLLPLIFLIIFRKKFNYDKLELKKIGIWGFMFVLSIGIYISNIFIQDKGVGSISNLYFETNNVSLNIAHLGIPAATCLDVYRSVFGIKEKIDEVYYVENDDSDFEYNLLDIDFSGGSGEIGKINRFMKNEVGSKKNKYTGIFKGKNIVFVVAESFSEIAVSKELTPTLYKLVHEGFDFKNFYTSNNLSTIGGEFQALTGLYADNTILSSWRGGLNNYPFGIGNEFKKLGYQTFAYHDSDAHFQDRDVYLKSQGIDNYIGCGTGLEKRMDCDIWPKSDIEMIQATTGDYLNIDMPFLTYYMTVSGHFYYNFKDNAIAKKNKNLVDHLDYPEEVKGYLATQIELDRAMELLLEKLKEANKLDDTVIVLLGDHYPYNLPIDYINKLSNYKRDSLIEANSNNLIIYNSSVKHEVVSKVCMSIDLLPTLYNLFGIDYDSRLFMGKDIFSSSEGIAIFKDKSWVTDKGTYYAATNKFKAINNNDVSQEYIDYINKIVANRVAISRMIVNTNYYKYVK